MGLWKKFLNKKVHDNKCRRKEKLLCLEAIKMIKNLLFRQVAIMEVNRRVYVRIAERKSHLVNLDIEIWETEILEINHGVKVVGDIV